MWWIIYFMGFFFTMGIYWAVPIKETDKVALFLGGLIVCALWPITLLSFLGAVLVAKVR